MTAHLYPHTMMTMTIEATVRIWREGEMFVAHALPLDISSAGVDPDSARAALQEAVSVFVATARDAGTLDDVLEECGYQHNGERWVAPALAEQRDELLAV